MHFAAFRLGQLDANQGRREEISIEGSTRDPRWRSQRPACVSKTHVRWDNDHRGNSSGARARRRFSGTILPGPVLAFAGSAGLGALKFVAAVALSGFLFHYGPRLVTTIKRIQARLVTQGSQDFVALAGLTIRTVSNGVIGVAVLQALLAGIGLKLAGVPHAGLLAFAVLILAVLQIGSAVVLIPVMIWIWATKDFAAALPSNDRGRRTRVIENQKHVRCGKNRRRGSGTNSTCRYQEGKQASLCERQANVAGTRQDNF
jgi:hypothetical protein